VQTVVLILGSALCEGAIGRHLPALAVRLPRLQPESEMDPDAIG
jgi:hypothetical protein